MSIVALWRSFGGSEELVGLYTKREDAFAALMSDQSRWTLPLSYRLSLELVE